MQTTITQVQSGEYELEIRATPDELAPRVEEALRAQRAQASMKGFRPGRVPMSLVKKMYGRALAFEIAEKSVQETYEKEVLKSELYDVLGQPKLTRLDYEDVDAEMHAVVRFGVRPEVELQDMSGETVVKPTHEVTDEDVDRAIKRLRSRTADLVPQEDGAGEEDVAVVDLQRLDDATGTPVIGEKEEGVQFTLDDPHLKEELRAALVGRKVGDVFRVDLSHDAEHGDEHEHEAAPASSLIHVPGQGTHPHSHTHGYQVTVRDLMQREMPELTPEFIREHTNGAAEDEEGFRRIVERDLQRAWDRRARELLHDQMVNRMLDRHPIDVPWSLVEVYLTSFIEDVKQRNQGKMPAGFDVEGFLRASEGEARRQAHWALVRDRLIELEGIEVRDEDWEAFYERSAADAEVSVEQIERLYRQVAELREQAEQRLLSEKVFGVLATQFTVEEKDRDEYEREVRAKAELTL